jgi:hypothetical protein
MAKLKYLGTTITNKNFIPNEIRSRLNSGNAWYHLVQNIFAFRFPILKRRLKIRILKAIIIAYVCVGVKSVFCHPKGSTKIEGN